MEDSPELLWEPAARRRGPIEMRLPADPELVSAIRLAASAMAATGKCTVAEIDDVKLAISEVLLALIEHGSGRQLCVSMALADSTFAISASTDTLTFDRSHPDLALSETVLAEVCSDHSIELAGSELRIAADVHLSRSDDR
jgi:anti-sigma regulatory factor (Ser/Thr protein kinase)